MPPTLGREMSYLAPGGHGIGMPPSGLRLELSIVVTSFPAQLSALKYWGRVAEGTIQECLMFAFPACISEVARNSFIVEYGNDSMRSFGGKSSPFYSTDNRSALKPPLYVFVINRLRSACHNGPTKPLGFTFSGADPPDWMHVMLVFISQLMIIHYSNNN